MIQNYLLIGASYYFVYQFNSLSLIVLLVYTVYIYEISNELSDKISNKKLYSLLLLAVLSFFLIFKYYQFFQESLAQSFADAGLDFSLPMMQIIPVLGLSFYIFHSVSYVVSVAKKEIPPASLSEVSLYLCFFPSIIAGPINRAKDFLPQIQSKRDLLEIEKALLLISLAIFKLFLLSAYFSENFVNPVFDAPNTFSRLQNITAVYAYAWEIYFNFSGYTNLVTGIALLLGFKVPINFNAPYLAKNLQEFWRDWHISLSTFIRDYIYIPLGGDCRSSHRDKKYKFIRKNLNIFMAMVISGLWHGAGLTFIIWGCIHGLGIVLLNIKHACRSLFLIRLIGRLPKIIKNFFAWVITFHFICLAWIFFRSDSLDTARIMLKKIWLPSEFNNSAFDWTVFCLFWLLFLIYPLLVRLYHYFAKKYLSIPWLYYPALLALALTVVFILSPSGIPSFIYANF